MSLYRITRFECITCPCGSGFNEIFKAVSEQMIIKANGFGVDEIVRTCFVLCKSNSVPPKGFPIVSCKHHDNKT